MSEIKIPELMVEMLPAREARDTLVRMGAAAVPALLDRLDYLDPRLSEPALEVLVAIGEPAVEPLLHLVLEDTRKPGMDALNALKLIYKDGFPLELMMQMLKSKNPYITLEAAGWLVDKKDERLMPFFGELFHDMNWDVREIAYKWIVSMGELSMPFLLESMQSGDDRKKERALKALEEIGGCSVAALMRASKDERNRKFLRTIAKMLMNINVGLLAQANVDLGIVEQRIDPDERKSLERIAFPKLTRIVEPTPVALRSRAPELARTRQPVRA